LLLFFISDKNLQQYFPKYYQTSLKVTVESINPTAYSFLSHFLSCLSFAHLQKHAPFGMHNWTKWAHEHFKNKHLVSKLLQKSKTPPLETKNPPKNLFSYSKIKNKKIAPTCLPTRQGKPLPYQPAGWKVKKIARRMPPKGLFLLWFLTEYPVFYPFSSPDPSGSLPSILTADDGVKTPSAPDVRTTCFDVQLLAVSVRLLATFSRLVDVEVFSIKNFNLLIIISFCSKPVDKIEEKREIIFFDCQFFAVTGAFEHRKRCADKWKRPLKVVFFICMGNIASIFAL